MQMWESLMGNGDSERSLGVVGEIKMVNFTMKIMAWWQIFSAILIMRKVGVDQVLKKVLIYENFRN